jgi:S-DNA-T family DNA segregation ATPase FtsK/SpoIIIE
VAVARRIKEEVLGVCSLLGGLYLMLSLASHYKWDSSFFTYSTSPAKNYGGVVGAHISDTLITLLGLSSFALPVFLLVYGIKSLLGRERHRAHLVGAVLFVLSASVLSGLMVSSFKFQYEAGGLLGRATAGLLADGLSILGAYILSLALFLSSIILLSPVSLIHLVIRPRGSEPLGTEQEMPGPEYFDDDGLLDEPLDAVVSEPLVSEPPFDIGPLLEPVSEAVESARGYVLPPLGLMLLYDPVERQSREGVTESSALLEKKLLDYAVKGRVVQVYAGPVVTMYEFEPAPGVKINRVVSLSEDLALALRAQSIRISPVPGKAAIGIEIPNERRETVSLREIISSDVFRRSRSKLTLALGKDIFGTPVTADLARMPHLLVAGATGAGKSVALNAMVLSLLYRARPDEVKMLMIDPKLLEFSVYNGVPHLIAPVLTNPKEAAEMLRKMVLEMEWRYRLIAEKGVRNIDSYNAASPRAERLPYIVIFIDELADLMFAAASHVEDSIARLAQMARASGIHLVLATQRPSVDVITGVIKANFPARIAFQVTTKIDSRTILDAQGAEQLIGMGDMLFMLPGVKILRVHGAFVTEREVKSITDFIMAQASPDFGIIERISQAEAEAASEAEYTGDRDELYFKAVEHAGALGEISISSIQRKLKVGYNRAARIMDLMEEDGLVGPPKAAGKPRDFLGRRDL